MLLSPIQWGLRSWPPLYHRYMTAWWQVWLHNSISPSPLLLFSPHSKCWAIWGTFCSTGELTLRHMNALQTGGWRESTTYGCNQCAVLLGLVLAWVPSVLQKWNKTGWFFWRLQISDGDWSTVPRVRAASARRMLKGWTETCSGARRWSGPKAWRLNL